MIPRELRWLWRQARPMRPLLLAQLSAVLVTSLLILVDPLILKWLIDDVLPWHKQGMLLVAAGAFAGCYAFFFAFSGLGLYLDTYVGQRVMLGIRLSLLRHLHTLSTDYFVTTPQGDTLHRLEQDVEQLRELSGSTLASLLRIAVTTTLTLLILALLSWKLTLLVLPLVPAAVLLRRWGYPHLKDASDAVAAGSAARVAFLQDHLGAMSQVQLLRREAGERRRFGRVARTAVESVVRRRGLELLVEHSSGFAMMLGMAIVLGFGGLQVLKGTMTIGGLVAFYTYLSRVFGPVQSVVSLYSAMQRTQANIRRLMAVFELKPTIKDPPRPASLPGRGPLRVAFEQVRFAYGAEPVLDELALSVDAGGRVALVGFTGSGKTTVGRLLVRLYDAQSGRVALDGVPVRDLRLRQLRRDVALVPQESILFDVSIGDNLRFADPRAGEDRLWEALRIAQLETTVRELPEGLDAPVGVRGQKLSGGERQRLAIARAILQRPRLLILDEATAALDGITEQRLLGALDGLTSEMTILLIAHRLSAIRWADRILVLDGGRLVDGGAHEELHLRCSLYRELCEKQLRVRGDEPAGGSEDLRVVRKAVR